MLLPIPSAIFCLTVVSPSNSALSASVTHQPIHSVSATMPASTTSAAEDTIYNTSQSNAQKPPNDAKPGVWLGIDLGTSFSSAAVWSIEDGRAKLLRLGGPACHNLAAPPKYKDGNYKKAGKSVPSAALFLSGVDAVVEVDNDKSASNVRSSNKRRSAGETRLAAATSNMPETIRGALEDVRSCDGILDSSSWKDKNDTSKISALLGYAASSAVDRSFQQSPEISNAVTDGKNSNSTSSDHHERLCRAYVTSVKRVLGVTTAQVKKELVDDEQFVKSLPFNIEVVHDEQQDDPNDDEDQDRDANKSAKRNTDEDIDEGVLIRVSPLSDNGKDNSSNDLKLGPIQIVSLLLRSIRLEAQQSLQKHKLNAPGSNDRQVNTVQNCVVGVPAHFGRIQRKAVERACRLAGFDGHVTTITESTAAAIAYGVFVSPKQMCTGDGCNEDDCRDADNQNKTILVFDMGGGTTDVTICEMTPDASRRFKVVATAGDRRLGGDDVDEALAQYVRKEISSSDGISDPSENEHRLLQQKCRAAKEDLCGNGDDPPPAPEVTVEHNDTKIVISQDKFNGIIHAFVSRADALVEEALVAYAKHLNLRRGRVKLDEVVLVGGSSRVPAVRSMLRKKFSEVPELCYSIKPEAAVSQGAAVQAAILSGCVPLHELRSAMMLDSLPHSLGVFVPAETGGDEAYIPILAKDMPLPALNSKPFFLADIEQPGITIVAVEDVGDEFPLQQIGEFTFLLHKLTDEQKAKLGGRRKVEVGFIVDENGKFTVSFFDELDPDHQAKKRRYLEMKRKAGELTGDSREGYESSINHVKTREELFLSFAIVVVLLLYVAIKLAFATPGDSAQM